MTTPNNNREIRITSENIVGKSHADCYLAPDDPVWEIMGIDGRLNLGKYIVNADVVTKNDSKT